MRFPHALLHQVVAVPWVYNQVQRLFGLKETRQRLTPYFDQMRQKIVLDVGGGTGLYRSLVPETSRYICLDIDSVKLSARQSNQTSDSAVLGDATRIGLGDHSIDCVICVAVSHHLSDQQLFCLMSELARVIRGRMIFYDALDVPQMPISRLLWKCDRGSFPRSAGLLLSAIKEHFWIEQTEQWKIHHRYLLCIARPKNQ